MWNHCEDKYIRFSVPTLTSCSHHPCALAFMGSLPGQVCLLFRAHLFLFLLPQTLSLQSCLSLLSFWYRLRSSEDLFLTSLVNCWLILLLILLATTVSAYESLNRQLSYNKTSNYVTHCFYYQCDCCKLMPTYDKSFNDSVWLILSYFYNIVLFIFSALYWRFFFFF